MVHAEETTTIARPCAEVFAAVTDLDAMPAWRANVASAQWVGEPGAGADKIRAVTQLLGVRLEWSCEVTTWEPPSRFGYIARNRQQAVEVEFRCDADPAGCQLTMVGGGDVPGGRIGSVAAPLYVKALLRENRKSLRTLKAMLERGDI
jgi:uncharacterized membrane protein